MAWKRRILGSDDQKTEYYWSDIDSGKVALETKWHNLDRIAKECKAICNTKTRHTPWGEWAHVASIPLSVIEFEKRRHGRDALKDKDFLRHLCNRDDLKAFRVRPGRV